MREKFNFSESNSSFIGEIELQNEFIEIEIKLKESELNWIEIKNFISQLDNDDFFKIKETSYKLLLEFVRLVPFGLEEPFNNYKFKLESVSYYGRRNNLIFNKEVDDYDLVFKIFHPNYVECYAPYSNYIVNVVNKLITGVRIEQV